ncbi:MAG: segregation/condensation protein A [Deltaproteobacteria bacterium]|nr:segregation/condensation protein A [Deltaproteobacteria bacterium]MBU50350.1 segregation/condensation protein A [Deltaproteobacteria bacterium]|tara:strand:- start:2479 stop:3390 length:912 start_codon:yes stop_codon:yes gene_type:complete
MELALDIQTESPLKLQLDVFEGPLDVLIHMIKEKDLDIFDIPIAHIAEEFQKYVDLAQTLELDRAGDYLSIAAELALIKSRMLLPITKEDEEDPRQELVDRLLEHQQMKEVSKYLHDCYHLGRDVFVRGADPTEGLPAPPPPKAEVDTNELQRVFNFLLRRVPRPMIPSSHQVRKETMTVRQRIVWLCEQLREQSNMSLLQLLGETYEKHILIVTFLALLELSRLRRIRLVQISEQDIQLETIDDLEDIPLEEVEDFDNMKMVQDQLDAHASKKQKQKKKRKRTATPKRQGNTTVTPITTPKT